MTKDGAVITMNQSGSVFAMAHVQWLIFFSIVCFCVFAEFIDITRFRSFSRHFKLRLLSQLQTPLLF